MITNSLSTRKRMLGLKYTCWYGAYGSTKDTLALLAPYVLHMAPLYIYSPAHYLLLLKTTLSIFFTLYTLKKI